MTESEAILWKALRRKSFGFGVRRQYPVGPYILDFFVHEAMLCIEVDGELHDLRKDRDAHRDAYLANLGIETLRIPSIELFPKSDCWIETLASICLKRIAELTPKQDSGTPSPVHPRQARAHRPSPR